MRSLIALAIASISLLSGAVFAADSTSWTPPAEPWQLPNAAYATTSGTANALAPTATVQASQVIATVCPAGQIYDLGTHQCLTDGGTANKSGSCTIANGVDVMATVSAQISSGSVIDVTLDSSNWDSDYFNTVIGRSGCHNYAGATCTDGNSGGASEGVTATPTGASYVLAVSADYILGTCNISW